MDILKISVAIAIVGLIALFFITQIQKEDLTPIGDLKLGQLQRIEGMINSVYVSRDYHVFIKVADNTGEVDVVAFKSANIDAAYYIEDGDQVSVVGKVEEYKGELEIIAKEIRKI